MNSSQEDAMGVKSKSASARGAARKRFTKAPARRAGKSMNSDEAWEQTAQVPDERDDELDCQRIVQGEGGRSLPPNYDDYN
jgi:hypothetical protein